MASYFIRKGTLHSYPKIQFDSNIPKFRLFLTKLAWIHHPRPGISLQSQLWDKSLKKSTDKKRNTTLCKILKFLQYIQSTEDICFRYPKMDKETLCLRVYSDPSFAGSEDRTFSGGIYHIFVWKEQTIPTIISFITISQKNGKIGNWK